MQALLFRRVCLLVKMASKTVIRPILQEQSTVKELIYIGKLLRIRSNKEDW